MSASDFCRRAEVRRSRKRISLPRRTAVAPGTVCWRCAGGEIFSNENAGMVYPLDVELEHPQAFPLSHFCYLLLIRFRSDPQAGRHAPIGERSDAVLRTAMVHATSCTS